MKDGHFESFKCKSRERATQIVGRRPNAREWNYYEDNERIPTQKKKVQQSIPTSFEELEMMMKLQRLI